MFRVLLVLATLLSGAAAQAAEPLSIKDAFRPPLLNSVRLSPDGRTLLASAYSGGQTVPVMIDVETLKATYVKVPLPHAAWGHRPVWLDNGVAAMTTYFGRTAIVRANGEVVSTLRELLVGGLAPAPDGAARVLLKHYDATDVFELADPLTGKSRIVKIRPPETADSWLFDEQGVARVVTTRDRAFWTDDTRITHWYRAGEDQPWQKLETFRFVDERWTPVQLMKDGSLLIYSNQGRDTWAYFRYDPLQRRLGEMVAGDDRFDVVARHGRDGRYEWVIGLGAKPELQWFEPRWAALQRSVDEALPGRINLLSGRPEDKVLVYSYGDVDPGRWLLLDVTKGQLRDLLVAKPEIDVDRMRPTRVVSYRSLDGLEIPAYLTLPAASDRPKRAVVLIHGGPVVRDHWGWDAEVQLLASRGYAVLQPQFRGSDGFGKRFREAGRGQWGLSMQDDITAAAQWLVAQGHAEADRLCVYGASYGGYAALWGLAKTPDLFRCGISYAGVSDIELKLKDDSDTNASSEGRQWMRAYVGDAKTDKAKFAEVSPLQKADRIKAPLLIAHGTLDERVPIEHSKKMVAQLKRHGKDHQWLELHGEYHGISDTANQQRFYDAMFDFLDRHIGERKAKAGP